MRQVLQYVAVPLVAAFRAGESCAGRPSVHQCRQALFMVLPFSFRHCRRRVRTRRSRSRQSQCWAVINSSRSSLQPTCAPNFLRLSYCQAPELHDHAFCDRDVRPSVSGQRAPRENAGQQRTQPSGPYTTARVLRQTHCQLKDRTPRREIGSFQSRISGRCRVV